MVKTWIKNVDDNTRHGLNGQIFFQEGKRINDLTVNSGGRLKYTCFHSFHSNLTRCWLALTDLIFFLKTNIMQQKTKLKIMLLVCYFTLICEYGLHLANCVPFLFISTSSLSRIGHYKYMHRSKWWGWWTLGVANKKSLLIRLYALRQQMHKTCKK